MRLAAAVSILAIVLPTVAAAEPVEADHFYPRRAQRLEVEGTATIACDVLATGLLTGCTVVDETPPGYGFGEAAIDMSASFRMKPQTKDGEPVAGGRVQIPIAFRLPPRQGKPDAADSAATSASSRPK